MLRQAIASCRHREKSAVTTLLFFNHLKPNSSNYYTSAYSLNLHFFNFCHSGTLALSPERQIARISEIENGMLSLYGTGHSKCNPGMLRSRDHIFYLGLGLMGAGLEVSYETQPSQNV